MKTYSCSVLLFMQMESLQATNNALSGEQPIHKQGYGNADACIQHTIEAVRNISIYRRTEKNYTKHYATRLYSADPMEYLAGENKKHHADKGEQK